MAASIAATITTIRIRGTLIRRSLLLVERRKLIEILEDHRDVFLELNGPCVLYRGLKLGQVLSLLRLGDSFVGLNRIDLLLYLIWWLGKGPGLMVDAGKDDGDIRRDVVVFGEACKAIFLDQSLGLHLQFWIRSVWIRAMIELRHVLGHDDEALHMLLGEFDLLHLLGSGYGGMKKREREKR